MVSQMKKRIKSLIWKTKLVKKTQSQQQKEKKNFNEDCLRDFWDNIKHNKIHIIWVPEKQERGQGLKDLLEEIMTKDFPKLVKKKRHTSPKKVQTKTYHN